MIRLVSPNKVVAHAPIIRWIILQIDSTCAHHPNNMPSAYNNPTDVVGDVLAAAFLHYPVMDFAFQGESEAEQARKLQIMFRFCANAARLYGGSAFTEEKDGALLWLPGSKVPLGLWRELRAGVAALPFQIGLRQVCRLMAHDVDVMQNILDRANMKQMGLIWLVGVEPTSQGKGYCRILMERAMTEMRTQGMTEFWLTTNTESNVKIYERLGFHVMDERVIKSSGLTDWVMRKLDVPEAR
ncbi:Aste57867_7935 [Aphanomyces stellatus]|uniref:Aste57867_7935 protein n=1 Tax=Aphanomyces stellatus TaxID=120398 RepID=A0A485KJ12_9STRA|nr:hypothetical protein As57867_007905 [Aphanomyces stellatus]VFT84828.1 Aste57867_7935 [Aphanomyces stellatus]